MSDRSFRCVFMGSPDFAVPTIQRIALAFPGTVSCVITQPDAPRGRGKHVSPTPVAEMAEQFRIPVFKPTSKTDILPILELYQPDFVVVVAYGMILPKAVTDHYFCFNGHASLLPKYRGAAPIHFAILNGDTETGVTLIKITEKMDAGDMLAKESISILPKDNLKTVHDKLSGLCADMIVSFIRDAYLTNQVTFEPQDGADVTFTRKLSKIDMKLDLTLDASLLVNQVRAFSPLPAAYVSLSNGGILKIIEAEAVDGVFTPIQVKPEGKPVMSYHDYLLSHPPIL